MDVSRFEWLEERDVWTTGAERTALVWQENCVTVAIAGPGTYYELSLNPANLAVDRGWSAECCLPWEGLARLIEGPLPPEQGQVWRIGLARTQMIDHRAHRYPAIWAPYPTDCPLPLMPDAYASVVFAP